MLEDISHEVLDIRVPTLVLAGENDQVEKIDLLERVLVPNIPTARITTIPGDRPSVSARGSRQNCK